MYASFDFFPIKPLLPGWPIDIIGYPEELDAIGVRQISTSTCTPLNALSDGTLEILKKIAFDLPLIPGVSFNLGSEDGSILVTYHIEVSGEYFFLSLTNITASIAVQSSLLKRMEPVANGYIEAPPDPITGEPQPVEISLNTIDLTFNSDGEFDITFENDDHVLTIPPFMIGNTGVIVDIQELQLILSATTATSLPETIPTDWRGVHLKTATIHFSGSLADIFPDTISFQDAFIGTGGFSGLVDWSNNVTQYDEDNAKTFLGFGFTLQRLALEFKQNTVAGSSIMGFIKIPFFDVPLQVQIALMNDGSFTIGFADLNTLLILAKPNVVSIEVASLEFVNEGNSFSIKLSGSLTPLIAGITWPSFELKGLTISTDGTVKVDGGWIEIPEQKALDFHGFKVEISKLGFGSDEEDNEQYKWVGFSGGIQILDSLPLKGGVEGLKVMWTEDGNFKLKIGGVYLSFEVDNVIRFDGFVNFIDEEGIKEFRGGVDLSIIPVNLAVNAQFITGRTTVAPFYNYFYIAVDLALPVGVPLGPPVLGLYGLAGLYAQNMTLDYQSLIDYDTVDQRPDLTDASPSGAWYNQEGAMAFGAGLTVGTLPDVKFTAKMKALLVILVPGPVLLIEGHAAMLSIADNYPMRVLAVLDATTGSFLMNISATYAFPTETGELVNIQGSAEAFFSAADPANWHLYLGQNTPEAKRIRADILSLFKAQTYLMIDNDGLRMGAWIGYGLNKKYGILRVVLEAWLSGELALSTMPLQAKGNVSLYGHAELSASIVKLGIAVLATVAAQAPKPLSMNASLQVQLKTPLGNPKATISLKWENTKTPPYPVILSTILGIEHRKVSKTWEVPKYSLYDVDDDGMFLEDALSKAIPPVPVVPPDVYLVLNFEKPVLDYSAVAGNPDPASGEYEKIGDYEFKYELNAITLEYRTTWNETTQDENWQNYISTEDTDYSLSGYWQFVPGEQNKTKLILNASTPFEINRLLDNTDMWYSQLETYNPGYPCLPTVTLSDICADVEERPIGVYYNILEEEGFIFTSPFPLIVQNYEAPWLDTHHSLGNVPDYKTITCLGIKFQSPSEKLNIKIIKEVVITAGVGYDSYLQLTNDYSIGDTELYINSSLNDPPQIPASIHFPQTSFPDLPYRVWITCAMKNPPDVILRGYDENGTLLDQVIVTSSQIGPAVYTLESSTVPIRHIAVYGSDIRIIEVCYEENKVVDNTSVLITPPQELVRAELYLSKGSQGTVFVHDRENQSISQINFSIPATLPDEAVTPVVINLATMEPFWSLLTVGSFSIIKMCGVTREIVEANDYNNTLTGHLQTTVQETWGQHTAQILKPNLYYRLKIETFTSKRKNGGAWDIGKNFAEYMFFKTGNPPGPPAQIQDFETAEADRYDLSGPLTSLESYIDYTIPAGATADTPQRRIYRTYDIGIVYNEAYVEQMYLMADVALTIQLLDNNNLPVTDGEGQVLSLLNAWGDNPALAITREEESFAMFFNTATCMTGLETTAEYMQESVAGSRDLLLHPLTQYRAQLMADDQPVYEFSFLTSRYASFLHHIHSSESILWNRFDLLQESSYVVDRTILQQILANAETESVQFEQLMEVFDLNPRTLPERIEVMLVNDGTGAMAFLIETPEPFDWERTELTLSYTDIPTVAGLIHEHVAIVNGSMAPVDDSFNNQWIDILLKETISLEGYTLEYATLPEQTSFDLLYTFTSGIMNAGTIIRVYNGDAPATLNETEYIQIYSGHGVDWFTPGGILIHLKDTSGKVVHAFTLHAVSAWGNVDIQIIRNSDGARCFLVPPELGTILPGTYQLQFTYKRDIGNTAPILKRFGSTSPEIGSIYFTL